MPTIEYFTKLSEDNLATARKFYETITVNNASPAERDYATEQLTLIAEVENDRRGYVTHSGYAIALNPEYDGVDDVESDTYFDLVGADGHSFQTLLSLHRDDWTGFAKYILAKLG